MLSGRSVASVTTTTFRLLIKGLSFSATHGDVSTHFSKYSSAIDLVHLLYDDKRPTGCAYIYFTDELEAKKACTELDGSYMGMRRIQVAINFLNTTSRVEVVHKPTSVDRFRLPSRY